MSELGAVPRLFSELPGLLEPLPNAADLTEYLDNLASLAMVTALLDNKDEFLDAALADLSPRRNPASAALAPIVAMACAG